MYLPKCLQLAFLGLLAISSAGATQATYFVSSTGSDANNGLSVSTPFATLTHARDIVESINSNMSGDIVVNVMQGDYIIGSTIAFTNLDSGTNGHNVIYQNYNANGSARFIGGTKVTSWAQYSGPIYRASVGTGRTFTTLYENGIRADMARWPKRTSAFATSRGGYMAFTSTPNGNTFIGSDNAISPTGAAFNPSGIDFSKALFYGWTGTDYHRWTTANAPVTGVTNSNGVVTVSVSSSANIGWPDDSFLLENSLGLLSQPGEYFYDSTGGYLYYYSRFPGGISSQEIIAPSVVRLLSVAGASTSALAQNIQFIGLTFMGTDRLPWGNGSDWSDAQQNSWDATVFITNAKSLLIQNCKVADSGVCGITFYLGTSNSTVTGCLIEHSGFHGVSIPNYTTDATGITLTNSIIRYFGELRGDGSGFSNYGALTVATNLEVYYGARAGISNRGLGADFSYIKVHDTIQDSSDVGGFYNPGPGYDADYNQCTSLHNFTDFSVGDVPGGGFYNDGNSTGTIGTNWVNCDAGDRVATGRGDNQYYSYRHDPQNEGSEQIYFTNCSWNIGTYNSGLNQRTNSPNASFNVAQMQYASIGITSAFPAEYNNLSAAPVAPINLWIQPGNGHMSLHWTESDHATSYNIKRSKTSGGGYVTIGSVAVPAAGYELGTNFIDPGVLDTVPYYYVITAVNGTGESPTSLEITGTPSINGVGKLAGTVIGTVSSPGNAFDGNLTTVTGSSGWVGLDLGSPKVVTEIIYTPLAQNEESYITGGQFQGATDAGFTTPVTLYTITSTKVGASTPIAIPVAIFNSTPFRYVRFYNGTNNSTIAEMQVIGVVGSSITSGTAYHLLCQKSGLALDNGGTTTLGAATIQSAVDGDASQNWIVTDEGGGYYKLTNQQSGMVLDNSDSTSNGTVMKQYTDNGGTAQRWQIVAMGGGYSELICEYSGKALDNGNTSTDGADVLQWTTSGGPQQLWQLTTQ